MSIIQRATPVAKTQRPRQSTFNPLAASDMENGSFGTETSLAVAESPRESTSPKGLSTMYRRHRKGKIISQGYTTKERQDVRREAAKTFLASIPLDQKGRVPPRRSANMSIQPIRQESSTAILPSPDREPLREEMTITNSMTPITSSQRQYSVSTESPAVGRRRKSSLSAGKKSSQANIDLGSSQSAYHLIHKYNIDPENKRYN